MPDLLKLKLIAVQSSDKLKTRILNPLKFKYKNWEGKTSVRAVKPLKFWYGKTKWHPEEQWLLKAFDLDKNEERDFAVKDILKFL